VSREADREYEEDEKIAKRFSEKRLLVPRPKCCEAMWRFPVVTFEVDSYLDTNQDPGRWWLSSEGTRPLMEILRNRDPGYYRAYAARYGLPEPRFCPYCGVPLPKMRRKVPAPRVARHEGESEICSTCDKRWHSCLCDPPEAAFELVDLSAAPEKPRARSPRGVTSVLGNATTRSKR
jgi:hypothetical protein